MCGIAGYFNARPQKELLLSMVSQLEHRGPDGFGYYIDKQAGLAHARLSIIDVEGGAQPISNEDGTIWVVFNGEIYNYIELRQTLEALGHIFYTDTDTEVIVHAYEEMGHKCATVFNGQFAYAIWDSNINTGFLTRDRVGIQPLFYSDSKIGSPVYFASEVKGLMANPDLRNGLNKKQISNVFTFWSQEPGKTVFEGISEVKPGQTVLFDDRSMFTTTYWDHDYTAKLENTSDLIPTLDSIMRNSTKLRLRSDVPVAAYLSGGLDSSIIASLARNYTENLNTFSIRFEDKQYDESSFQDEMAEALGVNHTSFICKEDDIAETMPQVVFHAEKPIFRTAPIPMFLLSKAVKESGFKVVLTGEGADEVFAGYDIFRENYVRRAMLENNLNERTLDKLVQQLYPWMNKNMLSKSTDYRKLFFGGKEGVDVNWFSHEPRWRTSSKAHAFFKEDMPIIDPEIFVNNFPEIYGILDTLDKAQYIEFKTLFSGYLISSQGDRMLMANGVEGRFPFLDPEIVDFGNSLKVQNKLHVDLLSNTNCLDEKRILKDYAYGKIPNSIVNRKKQPYMAPDGACLLGKGKEVLPYVDRVLTSDYGYFNMDRVKFLRKKFESDRAKGFPDNMALIGIISTQLLHEQFVQYYNVKPTVSENRFNVKVEKFD